MCHARSCVGVHASPTHAIICKVPSLLPFPPFILTFFMIVPLNPSHHSHSISLSLPLFFTSPCQSLSLSLSLSLSPLLYLTHLLTLSFSSSRLLFLFCRARNISCFISGIVMERTYMAETASFLGTYTCRYPVQYTHEIK